MRVLDQLWLPRSHCDLRCLPPLGTLPRAGVVRATGRLTAVTAVVALAALSAPVLTLGRARRVRAGRLIARALLRALGVRHQLLGRLPRRAALVVANHVSWLDVLIVLAHLPTRLVAKREVRRWPIVGALATLTGTLFIDRSRPRSLPNTVAEVTAALRAGCPVAVFPEGTTWCGLAAGRFRPAIFQAAIDADAPVVPVSLTYRLAGDRTTTIAAFLGDDALASSLRRVVRVRHLEVDAHLHAAIQPGPAASRRQLASVARTSVIGPQPSALARHGTHGSPADRSAGLSHHSVQSHRSRCAGQLPAG